MDNQKLSFKELLKELYQFERTFVTLIGSIFIYFTVILMLFFFILLPKANILGFEDLFMFLIFSVVLYLVFITPQVISTKKTNRIVFLTNSIIEAIIENVSDMDLFQNEKEKIILDNNLKSLYIFQKIYDYKYSIIVMGSIIEFLLIRYCNKNNIEPEPYTSPNGNVIPASKKRFCNYVQSAIKYDILAQKNSWYLIQNNLRTFRNYVHIPKEIKEEEIDHDWFVSTKAVFDRIIRNFKPEKKEIS